MKATFAGKTVSLLFLSLLLAACNKNKDTFMNRSYQNMVARYNVYFNGTQKLNETIFALEAAHIDDYTRVLDVFPYGSEKDRKAQSGNMDEVIKKASVVISDRPLSRWVDDAYLLMGKAYFFKADYFAAIETFQFINSKYKGSRISYEATLWIIRCYVMLNKEKEAEAIMGLLNNDAEFPEKLKIPLSEVSAFVYIREERYKPALEHMEKALVLARGSAQKARYHYILGQLYDRLGDRAKAREQFRIVTRGTPPYEMAFNAKINLARNYDPTNKNEIRAARKYLKSMLKDDKNLSYYPQIYYELGILEKKENELNLALGYFRQSNDINTSNKDQKALCYLEMADIYFKIPDYRQARMYYDSAVYFIQPDYKDYEQLKQKQEVLSELVKNLILIQKEDSLLKLAELPGKEIEKRIDEAIEQEKKQKEEALKRAEEEKNKPKFNNPMIPGNTFNQPAPGAANAFYFTDPMQVARGYNEFISRYGERSNTDNWQFAAIAVRILEDGSGGEKDQGEEDKTPDGRQKDSTKAPLDSAGIARQKYYIDIPFSAEAKANARERIAQAHLKTGEIYFEQLKEFDEAEQHFLAFINRFPGHEETPKALFYLYKLYNEAGNTEKANEYKATLITRYPDSPYTMFLTNDSRQSEAQQETLDPKIVASYQSAYQLYKSKQFAEVLIRKKEFDRLYFGSVIQPKFDFLEALSYGELDSNERCIALLENLVANYPTSSEALEAQRILNAYKKLKSKEVVEEATSVQYAYNPNGKHYVLMMLPAKKGVSMHQLKARFADFNKQNASGLSLALDDLLVENRQFLVIKEFANQEEAEKYLELVLSNDKFLKSLAAPGAEFIVADPKNLGLMVVNLDLKGFLTFQSTYYTK